MKVTAAALLFASALVAGTASNAAPAAAQHHAYPDQARTWTSYNRYGHDYRGQADRPGDYRCDAYWDRGRTDCDAAWRDQRPFVRHYASSRYSPRRFASYGYGQGQGQGQGQGERWRAEYGRPDLVYPSESRSWDRSGDRASWCSARYRSYDPASGYYRAYSGRLIFCG